MLYRGGAIGSTPGLISGMLCSTLALAADVSNFPASPGRVDLKRTKSQRQGLRPLKPCSLLAPCLVNAWRTGAAWAPLLPSQRHLLGPKGSGNRKTHRTTRKGALVVAWQAPEVEALRQIFLLIQPVEVIDGFAVSYVPVQVAIPVDGDAYHPTLSGTQACKIWGFRS